MFTQDEKLRRQYEIQEKAILDYNSSMDSVERKTKQQIAINLLKSKMTIKFVAENTGLSIEQVSKINQSLKL